MFGAEVIDNLTYSIQMKKDKFEYCCWAKYNRLYVSILRKSLVEILHIYMTIDSVEDL